MKGHIDKLSKKVAFDIQQKPVGAVQWDFICSIPEATTSMIKNYEHGPECIFLHLNSICSRGCPSCPAGEKQLDIDDIEYIISSQKNRRLNYIVLDGDPFLYRDFTKVVDLIKDSNITYSINSFSVPPVHLCEYVKASAAKIQFRLDNISTLDSYTSKIVEALDLCRQNKIYTAVIFSANKNNFSDIEKMVAFCEDHGVRQFSFSRLASCHFLKTEEQISGEEYLLLSKKLLTLREAQKAVHITSNDAIWKGCGACANSLTIMPSGDIVPCAYVPIVCGNIKDRDIENAWLSDVFHKIRVSDLKGKCGTCRYKFLCKGCRALSHIFVGDYQAEDKGCWL